MELTRRPSKISVTTLAEYILYLLGMMSHLKLQKLIYLIEGYHQRGIEFIKNLSNPG